MAAVGAALIVAQGDVLVALLDGEGGDAVGRRAVDGGVGSREIEDDAAVGDVAVAFGAGAPSATGKHEGRDGHD